MEASVVSKLMVNLKFPLSEVTEPAFERLLNGAIVGKIYGMSNATATIIYC